MYMSHGKVKRHFDFCITGILPRLLILSSPCGQVTAWTPRHTPQTRCTSWCASAGSTMTRTGRTSPLSTNPWRPMWGGWRSLTLPRASPSAQRVADRHRWPTETFWPRHDGWNWSVDLEHLSTRSLRFKSNLLSRLANFLVLNISSSECVQVYVFKRNRNARLYDRSAFILNFFFFNFVSCNQSECVECWELLHFVLH